METILAALEKAADAAFGIDSNQRIVYWNGAAEALFGYPAGEVLGRSCFEIIRGRDEHDHAWCRGNCHVAVGARAGETIETFNTLARTQDGGTRWINVSILALPAAADGEAALVLHLCRDATDLKRNEQIARQALALLQSWQQPAQPRAIHTIQAPLSPLTEREQEVLGAYGGRQEHRSYRRDAFHFSGDSAQSHSEHPPEASCAQPGRGCGVCV